VKNEAPVPPKSIHSDNDSSFLNEPLQSWCAEQGIAFRRARPYHSNDTCFVEQKNFNIVRQAVGYARYETEQEVEVLDRLIGRLLIGLPSVKLLKKERVNGRIRKHYDKPQTPATRLLACPAVSSTIKRRLRQQLAGLDPLELKRQIDGLQSKLLQMVRHKNLKIVYPGPPYPQARAHLTARLKATP
jgi:transposase InsO family protein